jgi:transposase
VTAELVERGVAVTQDTVWRCVRRLGLSFKKNSAGQGAGWSEAGSVPNPMEDPSGPA